MRQLGAESLRLMASLDLNVLGPVLEKRLVSKFHGRSFLVLDTLIVSGAPFGR